MRSVQVLLTQGQVATIDAEEASRVARFNWYAAKSGSGDWIYAVANVPERRGCADSQIKMHRLILDAPKGVLVDHINGDRLDNRRGNLRLCNHLENAWNSSKRKSVFTKYKGVVLDRRPGVKRPWYAKIGYRHQTINIGTYASELEAALAYDSKARELFGPFAKLNFPSIKAEPVRECVKVEAA